MIKNIIDHNGLKGINDNAWGYLNDNNNGY